MRREKREITAFALPAKRILAIFLMYGAGSLLLPTPTYGADTDPELTSHQGESLGVKGLEDPPAIYHFGPFLRYEKGAPIEPAGEEIGPRPRAEASPLQGGAAEKQAQLDLLGPLFGYREEAAAREYTLRPLFRWKRGKGYQELEFLYPLGKYRQTEAEGGMELPFLMRLLPFLATERRAEEGEEAKWSYFFLFPYYSAQSKQGERFWGIFPFYGRLEDWLGKEEIRFSPWPIYFTYTQEGSITRHLLFPLFSWTEGLRENGVKIWPFYGKREREGEFSRSFVLWPFYLSTQEELSSETPDELFALLPFYLKREARGTRTTGILYPFFTHTENEKEGFRAWDLPWPFVQKAEGKGVEKFWILPLWGKSHREDRDSRFILWPLYTYDRTGGEQEVEREVHRFLLINRSEKVVWKREGKEGRYLHFWPLFTYKRDKEQRVRLSILSLLPFEEEGFERHYAPLFRLYSYAHDGAGHLDSQLLWGLYRRERGPQEERINLSFLASWRRNAGQERIELTILKGLLGYRSQAGQRSLRILYLPWSMDW